MKYLTEFRNGEVAQRMAREIHQVTTRPWKIMEVCGGQTHSIIRNGIDQMIPAGIEMIHGPGCPVCVTPLNLIDKALAIASQPGVIFCSFGDMLRVPGTDRDLFQVKGSGGDVRVVYSPLDAVELAVRNPDKQVVFFGVGFETTAPANAMSVHLAKRRGLKNFSVLVSHVLVPPAIEAIMSSPGNKVQAFLAAGHVCSVMGYWEYPPIAEKVSDSDRRHRLRAARSARWNSPRSHPTRKGRVPRRKRLRAHRHLRRQPARAATAVGSLRSGGPCLAGNRRDSEERLAAQPALSRIRRRRALSDFRTFTLKSRHSASRAMCCAAPSNLPSARRSARSAHRAIRSAPPWFQARAPARPTSTMADSCLLKTWPTPVRH